MPYVRPFYRLVVLGDVYGVEDYSWSLAMSGQQNIIPPTEVPAPIVAAVTKFHQTTSLISQYAHMTAIKFNKIGQDGRYTEDETVVHTVDPALPGASTNRQAPQVSQVVSLMTAASRGRAHTGRFYLPLPGTLPDTNGTISPGDAAYVATAAAQFVRELNAAIEGLRVVVTSNLGTGTERDVTAVRVGRVLDTMRSRRQKFVEDYQTVAL